MLNLRKLIVLSGLLLVGGAFVANAANYKVDTKKSSIKWVGKKVTGQHDGTIGIDSGRVVVKKGKVIGGEFVINMNTITVLDLEGKGKGQLEGHLKSDDFFGVEKYPFAKYRITSVKGSTVKGKLTIKGRTAPLTIKAKIKVKDGMVSATAKKVKVDRTLYNVRYGSGKFFKGLGDKLIYDDFILDINLVAKK